MLNWSLFHRDCRRALSHKILEVAFNVLSKATFVDTKKVYWRENRLSNGPTDFWDGDHL